MSRKRLKRIWRKGPCAFLPFGKNWLKVSLKVLNLDCRKRILDVGCGFGRQIANFARLGHECVGVDLHKITVEEGNRVRGKLCGFVVADACHLPFREGCFDIVYSNEFFSHVTDVKQALSEQTRLLKRIGQLLVRDGNFLSPLRLFDLLLLYPLRTRGTYGGLKWIFKHDRIVCNLYGSGLKEKDENIKSLNWWCTIVMDQPNLKLQLATTSFALRHPNWITKLFNQLLGQIIVLAEKT